MSQNEQQPEHDFDETELRKSLQASRDYQPISSDADARIQSRLSALLDVHDAGTASTTAASSQPTKAIRSPYARWLTIAATAASLLVVLLFWPASQAYSFESMMKAMREQPLVRAVIRESGAIGWMRSGASGVIAVESRNSVYWHDKNQNRTLQYLRDQGELAQQVDTSESPQQLLELLNTLRESATVESETWQRVGDFIELSVTLQLNSRQANFVFGLDPITQLPQWVKIQRQSLESFVSVDLRYPESGPLTLASLGVSQGTLKELSDPRPSMATMTPTGQDDETTTPDKADELVAAVPKMISEDPDTSSLSSPSSLAKTIETTDQDHQSPGQPTRMAARRWQSTSAINVPDSSVSMIEHLDTSMASIWANESIEPAVHAADYELIRRLYLDLAGRVPLVHEIETAREIPSEELVEKLLASRDFSTHMATVWSRLLLPEAVDLSQFGGVEAFTRWLAKQFDDNVGYDEIVRQLLEAEGRVGQSGPVLFYTALELKPDHLAKQTARVFLGSRIDCAQCHDHPTDDWTQQDFWAYAAFFARISRPEGRMETMSPVLRVRDVPRGDVKLPDTEVVVGPRFLGGEAFVEQPGEALRRKALATWLTNSRQFARATVNHVWSHLFGVGFVDPADDFGPHNPAIAPELLDELAEYFISSQYDIRELVRVITATNSYSSSSATQDADGAGKRQRHFAQMNTKWLTAEQLYDALTTAARSTQRASSATGMTFTQRFGVDTRDAFVEKFKSPRGSTIEYQSGIPQALAMMNGGLTMQATERETSGMMKALSAPFFTDQQRVEKIFLACVGRPPSATEQATILPMIQDSKHDRDRQQILSDLFWALLNTAEFATNH